VGCEGGGVGEEGGRIHPAVGCKGNQRGVIQGTDRWVGFGEGNGRECRGGSGHDTGNYAG
jgi:hypothetical protein